MLFILQVIKINKLQNVQSVIMYFFEKFWRTAYFLNKTEQDCYGLTLHNNLSYIAHDDIYNNYCLFFVGGNNFILFLF